MTEMSQVQASVIDVPVVLLKVAGWCAYISGIAAIFGLVFIVVFYAGFLSTGIAGVFGPMNDVAVIIHYILLLPIMFTIWLLLRPLGRPLNDVALVIGLVGVLAVIVLQTLLVVGMLPFTQQIKMVIPAFLVAMSWFVITGQLARSTDLLPKSAVLQVLAGLVFGYPVWAFKVGQRLLSGS